MDLTSTHTASQELPETTGGKQESCPTAAHSAPCVEGGLSIRDIHKRLKEPYDGFTEAEMVKMNRVFHRFKDPDFSEVNVSDLPDMAVHLGYFGVTDEVAQNVASQVTTFATLDVQEFIDFISRLAVHERKWLETKFKTCTQGHGGKIPFQQLPRLLHEVGVPPLHALLKDVLDIVGLSGEDYSLDDVLLVLAAIKSLEGFTRAEATNVIEVYNDTVGFAPAMNDSRLSDALAQLYGQRSKEKVKLLLQTLNLNWTNRLASGGGATKAALQPCEFLVFARRVRDIQLKELQSCFTWTGQSDTALIHKDDLPAVINRMGFTLFPSAIDEFLRNISKGDAEALDFSDFVELIRELWHKDGFTKCELEEVASVFDRFDYDNNRSIDSLELVDLLRFLGYTTTMEEAHRLMQKMDFNRNGTIEFKEFTCLMRLQRELYMKVAIRTFDLHKDSQSGKLPVAALNQALEDLQQVPGDEMGDLLAGISDKKSFSLEDFVELADTCRKTTTQEKRRRAGFSGKEFDAICQLFGKHCQSEANALDRGELILLLIDLRIPMDTMEERAGILELLPSAREAARSSGAQEKLRPSGDFGLGLWGLVHLLRLLARQADCMAVTREQEATKETGFSAAEVADFREVFSKWSKRQQDCRDSQAEQGDPSRTMSRCSRSRRTSLPDLGPSKTAGTGEQFLLSLERSLKSQRLTLGIVHSLLSRSLGLCPSHQQCQELEERANQITGCTDGAVDFADFLLLMRWMLDANFGNINAIAEQKACQAK